MTAANIILTKPIAFDANGLIPVIVQDAASSVVLMVAWMNEAALSATSETGEMHYWSRSRQKLWRKGEQSGQTQKLIRLRLDCDGDTLLAQVEQTGVACHTGRANCFYREWRGNDGWVEILPISIDPKQLYPLD